MALKPFTDIIEVDLSNDLIRIQGEGTISSISLDGNPLPIDKKKNVDIPIGLAEIKQKLNEYQATRTVKVPFTRQHFVSSGRQFELRVPLEAHQRGYGAIIERVDAITANGDANTFFQAYTRANGSVAIVVDEPFDGAIYIKGVI